MVSSDIRLRSEIAKGHRRVGSASGEVAAEEVELVGEDGLEPVAAGPDVEVVAGVVADLGAAGLGGLGGGVRRGAAVEVGDLDEQRAAQVPSPACRGGGCRARCRPRRRSRCARSGRRSRGRTRSGRAARARRPRRAGRRSASARAHGRAATATRLRTPAAVERRIARGGWCFSASRRRPGRRRAGSATRRRRRRRGPLRRRARGRRTARRPTARAGEASTPGSRAAAAIAAR